MFRRLLRHIQGEVFCMLKTIVTVCDYIGLQTYIIYVFYCTRMCAFMKKFKEWKASGTHILYMSMCWIYSIILELTRSTSDFR